MLQNSSVFNHLGEFLLHRKITRIFFCVSLVVLVARAQLVFDPLYAIDTYSFTDPANAGSLYKQILEQGRYGFAALWWLGERLDFAHFDEAVYGYVLSIFMMTAAGLLLSKVIFDRDSIAQHLSFGLLFSLHPFMNELYHFGDGTVIFTAAMLLSASGLATCCMQPKNYYARITGSLLIAASLTLYQTVLSYIIVAALMAAVNTICLDEGSPKRNAFNAAVSNFVTIGIGVTLYFLFVVLANHAIGIHITSRFDPASFLDLTAKMTVVRDAIKLSLWPRSDYITSTESVLLLVILCVSLFFIMIRSLRHAQVLGLIFVSALLVGCLVISTSLTSVGKDAWLVPRTLSGFAVLVAALVASGWRYLPMRGRLLFGVMVALLVSSYIGIANRVIHDQFLVNRWDFAQANRIVERLEQNARFPAVHSLALVGGSWARTMPVSSAWGDMNISAFGASWAKLGIIEQATGMRFEMPSIAKAQDAVDYCRINDVWPASSSTEIDGDVAVICLTKPQ